LGGKMMSLYRISIKIEPEELGEAFANTDSNAQAKIFNSMASDLKKVCGSDFGMQLVSMAKDLDQHAKDMIKSLNDFINWDTWNTKEV
jgi:hypothetical protein